MLFDEAYWRRAVAFDFLAEQGMIGPHDLDLFAFAEDAEGIWARLVERGLAIRGRAPRASSVGGEAQA